MSRALHAEMAEEARASSVPTCRCGERDFSPNVEAFELTGELVCEDCADGALEEWADDNDQLGMGA